MSDLDIRLEGWQEIDNALKRLPWRVAGNLTSNATRSGAAIIRKYARRYAPKLTGRLRKAIIIKRTQRSRYGVTYSIGYGPKASYYGPSLELGGTYKVRGGVRHQPAIPHLRPAIINGKREAVKKVGDMLWKGIRREAARLR